MAESKAFTVRELMAALNALIADDPSAADLELAYDTGAEQPNFLQGVGLGERDDGDGDDEDEDDEDREEPDSEMPERWVELF